jgi:hypothetical protein
MAVVAATLGGMGLNPSEMMALIHARGPSNDGGGKWAGTGYVQTITILSGAVGVARTRAAPGRQVRHQHTCHPDRASRCATLYQVTELTDQMSNRLSPVDLLQPQVQGTQQNYLVCPLPVLPPSSVMLQSQYQYTLSIFNY